MVHHNRVKANAKGTSPLTLSVFVNPFICCTFLHFRQDLLKKRHGSRLQTSLGGQMIGAIVPKLILIVLYWLFKSTLIMDFILSNNGLISCSQLFCSFTSSPGTRTNHVEFHDDSIFSFLSTSLSIWWNTRQCYSNLIKIITFHKLSLLIVRGLRWADSKGLLELMLQIIHVFKGLFQRLQ